MRTHFLAAALASVLLFAPRAAFGRAEFPDRLQEATHAPCVPQCSICHESVQGGGPADQPFAKSLRRMGKLEGPDAIKYAVDQLEQQNVDSDGDGVGDIAEIRAGKDPNYARDALICLPDVGCGAHVSREAPSDGLSVVLALGVALALVLTRRSRR
jgi:hypothetical protein